MNKRFSFMVACGLVLALAGCSRLGINTDGILQDKSVDYKRERQAERRLEVPPDLTSSSIDDKLPAPDVGPDGSATYSEYAGNTVRAGTDVPAYAGGGQVLPGIQGMRVMRDGDSRWLLVNSPPEAVWPRVVDFWQDNGILLVEQDPSVGIMRTSWLENRADISSDLISDTIRSVFEGIYDAGTRDQYRVRLERGLQPGTTEVYLTHFGMEEQLVGQDTAGGAENSVWQPRGRDAGLEAEMLRRLMNFLGVADQRARQQLVAAGEPARNRSQLVKGQRGVSLLIGESFAASWRLTGLALDRVGFAVEDRDRSQGIYYVRYTDPTEGQAETGWLSRFKFWGDDEADKEKRYQVRVRDDGRASSVTVHDEQGARSQSGTAERILTLIHEQIR